MENRFRRPTRECADFGIAAGDGQAFGKHAHRILVHAGERFVPAHDIVVQRGLNIPPQRFRHLREVMAAHQTLFLPGDGQENNGSGKFHLAQHAGAFQAHGGAAGIVVGAGSYALGVQRIGIPRIVMSGHQHDAACRFWIGPLQNRINIGDFRRVRDAVRRLGGECVGLDLKAAVTIARVAFELALNPLLRRTDSVMGRNRRWILRGNRLPRPEAHQLGDVRLDALTGNLPQRRANCGVGSLHTGGLLCRQRQHEK